MLKDIKSYIGFDIVEYFSQIKLIVPMKESFAFQQVLAQVLPSIFVKMTGCLEHKFDMMSLQLSMDDEQWRQSMMRKNSSIPSSGSDVAKVVEALTNYITDNFDPNYTCEIWTDRCRLSESVQKICSALEIIGIGDYLGAPFVMLKSNASNLNLPAKLSTKSNKGNPQNKDFIEVVYNQTVRFRNAYAHNEDSVYAEFNSPKRLNSEIARYNNWCFRFTAITYMDIMVRKLVKDYMDFREKSLLM